MPRREERGPAAQSAIDDAVTRPTRWPIALDAHVTSPITAGTPSSALSTNAVGNTVPTSAAAAKTLGEIGVEPSFMFSRMSMRGVFVQAGGDRWWYDAAAWNRYRDRQWKRLVVGAVVIILFCALLLLVMMIR